jgi:precorrin-2/cobalt-factor-2 C20-methyltransferase
MSEERNGPEAINGLEATKTALPGHLYLVGVGPGAPDLLTLRALKILESVDLIIAPRSSASEASLVLGIVRPHLRHQEVIEHIYPMARDREQTARSWRRMADLCVERLRTGQSVAHVTLGDPLIYSTCTYLMEEIGERIEPSQIHFVSGISAMQAAAALLDQTLLTQNDRLMLMPADDMDAVAAALDQCETLVLYKIAHRLDTVIELLRQRDLLQDARLVSHAEQPGERIIRALDEIEGGRLGYMSVLIVRIGHRDWK